MEDLDALSVERLFLVAQQVSPLESPEIRELVALKQLVDLLRTLALFFFSAEGPCLRSCRQATGQVKGRTPQKGRIVTDPGGIHPHAPELPEDLLVDEIFLRMPSPAVALPRGHKGQPDRNLVSEVPDQDGCLPERDSPGESARGNLGRIAGGFINGKIADLSPAAVGEPCENTDFQFRSRLHDNIEPLSRDGLKLLQPGGSRGGARKPGPNPIPQDSKGGLSFTKTAPPLMGKNSRRLQQDQALTRIHPVDPPPPQAPGNHLEVPFRILPPQRKLEAPLALAVAMTGTLVAAGLGQDCHHII